MRVNRTIATQIEIGVTGTLSSTQLAYDRPSLMNFGVAPHPVECGFGVVIGGGEVIPEVNFTLPPMLIRTETLTDVRARFADMADRILTKAAELHQAAVVLEFEQLFELTLNPDWGAAVTADIKDVMQQHFDRDGIRSALRVTVADIRDKERPPQRRSGELFATMQKSFELCAAAGADILAIESTGGKEVSDEALMQGDIDGLVWALGALGPRDMTYLWTMIVDVAKRYKVVAGGDTACGFANTAMQLAHQNMLPGVLAAVVRLMAAPRSLAAVEAGAVGPLKDCGYENPIIKALTGVPISMEGKSSACAHSSPLGNVAAAVCDLWSNESVQDVRLLAGFAPEVFAEILIYDCRLMNTAQRMGHGEVFRDLLEASDVSLDSQALVMGLDVTHEAARTIAGAGPDGYQRTIAVTRYAAELLAGATESGRMSISDRDRKWLGIITEAACNLPDDEAEMRRRIDPNYGELYIGSEYGLS